MNEEKIFFLKNPNFSTNIFIEIHFKEGVFETTFFDWNNSLLIRFLPNNKSNKELERTIVELGRKGLTEEAIAVYESIPKPTVRLMNSAMDACARARPTQLQKCFDILQKAPPSITPNVFTFGALMSACARARRGDKARHLLKFMQVSLIIIFCF